MDLNVTDDQWCFACGKHNTHGLQMQGIHLEGTVCVAHYQTHQYHQGWAGIVHGGITATLLDEVMTHAVVRRGHNIAMLIGKAIRGDDALQRNDLAIGAGTPNVLTLGRPHIVEITTTHAEIDVVDRGRESGRSPPTL